jgi:hypothetical protein
LKWNQALLQASRGEQILLNKVLQDIKSPFDLHQYENSFKWIQRIVEYHRSKHHNWLHDFRGKQLDCLWFDI